MTKLSSDNKDQLLIRLLSQERGSLEFARNMLTGSDDIDPPSPQPEHRLYVDSLSFRRLMPSGLLGRPLAGRLSAILVDVSTNRDRKPTTQCPWKEFSSTNANDKAR